MNNFDIRFQTNYSDDEKNPKKISFTLTFMMREHSLSLGHYVIFPSLDHRELILMPKYKFNDYEKRFLELSEKIQLSEKEKSDDIKPKNRKYYVSEEEILEAKKLRSIISHSHVFAMSGYETSVTLPYKYVEMLQVKDEFLTFVQTDENEFLVINPADAWMFSANSYFNSSDSKPFFNRIKKVI
ncbi:MAG: hypothetical protein MR503_08800 [Oscillospiraceae bacterium]|nr:hypothetical protein [Oscillospiraceae bacterium]